MEESQIMDTGTGAAGGNMVVVKVRETYDLHTVKNKMTVIAIHTPKPDILKRNYPGLLMQCKAYRPLAADVRVACASMMPLDPLGVGTQDGDVSPEDVFNPILYKAISNFGMSQLEARIAAMTASPVTYGNPDIVGNTATVDVDSFTTQSDEFNLYYGLLSNTHDWKHASPQAGLSMTNLRPLVWEVAYNIGDQVDNESVSGGGASFAFPDADGTMNTTGVRAIRGGSKPMPFINCLSYTYDETKATVGEAPPGFTGDNIPWNAMTKVPYLPVIVGALIIPPSKLHELFFRMVVEWDIEFTKIRPLSEITNFTGVSLGIGAATHYQNYSYASTKEAVTGSSDTILENDSCMVSANVGVDKVM